MIIAFDPGSRTGIGLLHRGRIVRAITAKGVAVPEIIPELIRRYRPAKAAVEKPALSVFYGRYNQELNSQAGRIKLAQNVGQNIALTESIVRLLIAAKIKTVRVQPKRGGTKWEPAFWAKTFDWKSGRVPSEHARDAVCLGYFMEDWQGFNLPGYEFNA